MVDWSEGQVNASTSFNSLRIPTHIVIYGGMVMEVRNIDELAAVIGHELGHTQVWWQNQGPKNELTADRLGFKFMKQAGFDVCRGAQLLKRFHDDPTGVHPAAAYRYKMSGCK
jgi:predicted Zn-dependent protease